ncbi:TonB C-terminal domain-containing protein [Cognaticolwellia aestuarii]|uniref:TonB C-terminal domain-containing protein n=1 Tax=Cognaticolwellia aestuarii TaxID=329993 RepID=UPI0009845962|nr:TonB C-terminal domain-containing protein [Cognaticolwellia aestuarii]
MSNLSALILSLFLISGCATTDKKLTVQKCTDVQSCAQNIMQRVREKSKWICDQKSTDKVVVVESSFTKLGEIVEMKLTSSSGDSEFDDAAFKAIESAAPLVELTMLNNKDFEEASVISFKFVGNAANK